MITPQMIANNGSEHAHQAALFAWAALNRQRYPQLKWLYAVPNGFFSTKGQKVKMKAEGLRTGVPDVWLPVPIRQQYDSTAPDSSWHGLIIEMKIEKYRNHHNGGCSADQVEWLDYLKSAGYKTAVCYSWIEAVKVIEEYLS